LIELSLFPLNTVLFPGTPVTLHIFEERYKRMFRRCITQQEPFGVVLIQKGLEALGPIAEPFSIGCTARITFVEELEGGRLNVIGVGGERFRITSVNRDLEYLVGNVEILPLDYEPQQDLLLAGRDLRPWVKQYLRLLIDADLIKLNLESLPYDPLEFAYLSAYFLQTPIHQKQELLEVSRGTQLIEDIRGIYRREVALLRNMLAEKALSGDSQAALN
jgi:Lon protease-like protein